MEKKAILKVFKALSDETRLEIMSILSIEKCCACQIQEKIDITQPTLSHHMKVLVDSELLIQTKIGKWVYYQINPEVINAVSHVIHAFKETKDPVQMCEV